MIRLIAVAASACLLIAPSLLQGQQDTPGRPSSESQAGSTPRTPRRSAIQGTIRKMDLNARTLTLNIGAGQEQVFRIGAQTRFRRSQAAQNRDRNDQRRENQDLAAWLSELHPGMTVIVVIDQGAEGRTVQEILLADSPDGKSSHRPRGNGNNSSDRDLPTKRDTSRQDK